MNWGEKRFNNLDFYLKNYFGEKVYKVSLDGGFTCPNRDGKLSFDGCIFCSDSGSGEFAGDKSQKIYNQIEKQMEFLGKGKDKKYIAYFQNFTGTYGDINYLREIYESALSHENIVGIAIGTRADCLDLEVIELLRELNKRTLLWIEIGLQSSKDETAILINRGYKTSLFEKKVKELQSYNIKIVAHVIIGLPFEEEKDIFETINLLNKLGVWGVKIHLMYILKNTKLHKLYLEKAFKLMSKDEYVSLVAEIIGRLSKDIVVHRLTGDAPWKDLFEPKWSTDKRGILNQITKELKEKNIYQGKLKED